MTNVLGHKNKIAIEYELENKERSIGRAVLWIRNDFLGSLYDTIFLSGYLAGGLFDISKKDFLNWGITSETALITMCDILNDYENEYYDDVLKYRVNFGTWGDYFDIFSYKINEYEGVLMWKIKEESNFLPDLKIYPKKFFVKKINYEELNEMANLLCSRIYI